MHLLMLIDGTEGNQKQYLQALSKHMSKINFEIREVKLYDLTFPKSKLNKLNEYILITNTANTRIKLLNIFKKYFPLLHNKFKVYVHKSKVKKEVSRHAINMIPLILKKDDEFGNIECL